MMNVRRPAGFLASVLACLLVIAAYVMPVAALDEGVSVSNSGGDQVRLLEDIKINEAMTGNVIVILGNVEINQPVDGIVISVFGDVKIDSSVTQQVVTVFGSTVLGKGAEIGSNLITLGPIAKDPGARVKGNEVRIFGENMDIDVSSAYYLRIVSLVAVSLLVLILGLLMILLSRKKYINDTAEIEKNAGRKLLLGLLTYIGAAVLLVLLSVTILAPVFYLVLMLFANVFACLFFGRLIIKAMSAPRNIMVEFLTGYITITLVKLLAVFLIPRSELLISLLIGLVVGAFVSSMGLGIMMEGRFTQQKQEIHRP
jgi:hypothetical protein